MNRMCALYWKPEQQQEQQQKPDNASSLVSRLLNSKQDVITLEPLPLSETQDTHTDADKECFIRLPRVASMVNKALLAQYKQQQLEQQQQRPQQQQQQHSSYSSSLTSGLLQQSLDPAKSTNDLVLDLSGKRPLKRAAAAAGRATSSETTTTTTSRSISGNNSNNNNTAIVSGNQTQELAGKLKKQSLLNNAANANVKIIDNSPVTDRLMGKGSMSLVTDGDTTNAFHTEFSGTPQRMVADTSRCSQRINCNSEKVDDHANVNDNAIDVSCNLNNNSKKGLSTGGEGTSVIAKRPRMESKSRTDEEYKGADILRYCGNKQGNNNKNTNSEYLKSAKVGVHQLPVQVMPCRPSTTTTVAAARAATRAAAETLATSSTAALSEIGNEKSHPRNENTKEDDHRQLYKFNYMPSDYTGPSSTEGSAGSSNNGYLNVYDPEREPSPYRCGHCYQASKWKLVVQVLQYSIQLQQQRNTVRPLGPSKINLCP